MYVKRNVKFLMNNSNICKFVRGKYCFTDTCDKLSELSVINYFVGLRLLLLPERSVATINRCGSKYFIGCISTAFSWFTKKRGYVHVASRRKMFHASFARTECFCKEWTIVVVDGTYLRIRSRRNARYSGCISYR